MGHIFRTLIYHIILNIIFTRYSDFVCRTVSHISVQKDVVELLYVEFPV